MILRQNSVCWRSRFSSKTKIFVQLRCYASALCATLKDTRVDPTSSSTLDFCVWHFDCRAVVSYGPGLGIGISNAILVSALLSSMLLVSLWSDVTNCHPAESVSTVCRHSDASAKPQTDGKLTKLKSALHKDRSLTSDRLQFSQKINHRKHFFTSPHHHCSAHRSGA